jgi:integrase
MHSIFSGGLSGWWSLCRSVAGPQISGNLLDQGHCVRASAGCLTGELEDFPVHRHVVTFMLGTGVRIGEALAVAWDQIDFDEATVTIAYTLIRIKGQGLVRKSTKTAAGTRVLPLPQTTVAMRRRRRRAGRIGTIPVFPDSHGGWRDPYNTSRDIRNARGAEEFAWVTSHVFRKTAATMLDEAGLSACDMATHLGHARPSLTQDVYLGRGVANRRAAEVLGESQNSRVSGT